MRLLFSDLNGKGFTMDAAPGVSIADLRRSAIAKLKMSVPNIKEIHMHFEGCQLADTECVDARFTRGSMIEITIVYQSGSGR
jgi:hypothetical protein